MTHPYDLPFKLPTPFLDNYPLAEQEIPAEGTE